MGSGAVGSLILLHDAGAPRSAAARKAWRHRRGCRRRSGPYKDCGVLGSNCARAGRTARDPRARSGTDASTCRIGQARCPWRMKSTLGPPTGATPRSPSTVPTCTLPAPPAGRACGGKSCTSAPAVLSCSRKIGLGELPFLGGAAGDEFGHNSASPTAASSSPRATRARARPRHYRRQRPGRNCRTPDEDRPAGSPSGRSPISARMGRRDRAPPQCPA